jgi:hypothetical protein
MLEVRGSASTAAPNQHKGHKDTEARSILNSFVSLASFVSNLPGG